MSEGKPTEPTEAAEPTASVPTEAAEPTSPVPTSPIPPAPAAPQDYIGGFNAADALKAGMAGISATINENRKRRRYSGGQWFLSFALLFSGWVAFSGDGKFNFLAFIIMFGILWLISAPFRVAGWAVRRANSRPCPVCGLRITNGETQCQSCGTDFTIR